MRRKTDSPLKRNFLCDFLNRIWSEGWLDDFSDENFLIKAMNNEVESVVGYAQLKQNNFDIYDYNGTFSLNFCLNLSHKLQYLCDIFGEEKIKEFVETQLSAGKTHYDENQFFRALSEIEVLKYYSTFGPDRLVNALYEPPIGLNGRNPEARFYYNDGTVLDIEVKTPGFHQVSCESKTIIPAILLSSKGRDELHSYTEKHGITCILPRVHKLVDFINSAASKFEVPTSEKHINLLYINWTYSEFPSNSFLEPYSILFNDINGLIKNKKIGMKIRIKEEAYNKISGIIVYTSSLNTIVFQDFRYLWSTRCFSIMPFVSDRKQLLRVSDMDCNKNRPTPYFLCDFKTKPGDLDVEGASHCVQISEIIKNNALQ